MSKTWEQEFGEAMHRANQRNQIGEPIKPPDDREHDARNLAHAILVLCRLAGFQLQGRLHLVDKATGQEFF